MILLIYLLAFGSFFVGFFLACALHGSKVHVLENEIEKLKQEKTFMLTSISVLTSDN